MTRILSNKNKCPVVRKWPLRKTQSSDIQEGISFPLL